jgi:hypothetical protein
MNTVPHPLLHLHNTFVNTKLDSTPPPKILEKIHPIFVKQLTKADDKKPLLVAQQRQRGFTQPQGESNGLRHCQK